jgi:hypothetical protein
MSVLPSSTMLVLRFVLILVPLVSGLTCDPGEYAYNNTACVECEYGKYAPQGRVDSCLSCGVGYYTNNATKATQCNACPSGYDNSGYSDSCNLASPGYYLRPLAYNGELPLTSLACVNHATCYGDRSTPIPAKGYWLDHSNIDYLDKLYKCSRSTCTGVDNFNLSFVSSSSSSSSSSWDSDKCYQLDYFNHSSCAHVECKEGAQGFLCGSCSSGHVYESSSKYCVKCSEAKMRAYFILMMMLFVVLMVGVFYVLEKQSGSDLITQSNAANATISSTTVPPLLVQQKMTQCNKRTTFYLLDVMRRFGMGNFKVYTYLGRILR